MNPEIIERKTNYGQQFNIENFFNLFIEKRHKN